MLKGRLGLEHARLPHADRYHGFLSSLMPEIAPGVFVSAGLSRGARERMWTVLSAWWDGMAY